MAIELNAGFFNAVLENDEPDRVYSAEQVNDYFKGLISESGIFQTYSTACQVVASEGMQVILKAGRGKVGSNWFEVENDTTIDISASDVILNRIDTIVIRRDNTNRIVEVVVKEGTLASNPTAPTLTRDEDIYEIALANIHVNKNVSTITTSMIEDVRSNSNVCGWIVGLIEEFDTTTLFNQYKNAQDKFINEQTTEFNEWSTTHKDNFTNWETTQKTTFETWFETMKETIVATSLYREYTYLYATTEKGEKTFTIPSSINYVANSTDVLSIFINGMRLHESQYTINSVGTITLATALSVVGTEVEFVNKKCVEGTVDESTILRVEALENKVNAIGTYVYEASGTKDNETLSNMVKNFLDGVGDYASVQDTSQLYIEVSGVLGVESIDGYGFDFNSATTSNRRVIVDFARATIPEIAFSESTVAIMSIEDNVIVKNANIKATQKTNQTMYVFHGGIYKGCNVYVSGSNGTFYGAYDCEEVSDSKIVVENATGTVYGVYYCVKALYNTINVNRGTTIYARGKQLLLGNFVNSSANVDTSVTNIGTIVG